MRSRYIMRLNNLDDWYVAKVSANQTCFETYMESNNSKIVCCIISPSYWSFNKWQLFISNTDKFGNIENGKPTRFSFLESYINPAPQCYGERFKRDMNGEIFLGK